MALSLPDDDENKIKDKVFDQIALDELKDEDGLNIDSYCVFRQTFGQR